MQMKLAEWEFQQIQKEKKFSKNMWELNKLKQEKKKQQYQTFWDNKK